MNGIGFSDRLFCCLGACGTCPSSTVTMKMGIERVLKEKFGDAVKEVVQADQQQIGATVQVCMYMC